MDKVVPNPTVDIALELLYDLKDCIFTRFAVGNQHIMFRHMNVARTVAPFNRTRFILTVLILDFQKLFISVSAADKDNRLSVKVTPQIACRNDDLCSQRKTFS